MLSLLLCRFLAGTEIRAGIHVMFVFWRLHLHLQRLTDVLINVSNGRKSTNVLFGFYLRQRCPLGAYNKNSHCRRLLASESPLVATGDLTGDTYLCVWCCNYVFGQWVVCQAEVTETWVVVCLTSGLFASFRVLVCR